MKITYIDNACCIYESEGGFKLLADPWLTDGAFEGSWYHEKDKLANLDWNQILGMDALYISHVHPDHFDPETLRKFRKDIPLIVLDHGPNFLHKNLQALGFTNLVKVKDKKSVRFSDLEITVYAPFVKHPYDESDLGNFLDSAIVLKDSVDLVLNANDNTPTEMCARALRITHGPFTVAQLKYALAGPYPSCFTNLSHEEKLSEKDRLLQRQKTSMDRVAHILEAKAVPFAGSYCLAGSLAHKNTYLAVDELDLSKVPEGKPYSYELDPSVSSTELFFLCEQALEKLRIHQKRFNYFPNYNIAIKLGDGFFYKFNLKWDNIKVSTCDLVCEMDPRLLKRILTKQSHWNNAEVGCHIDFRRFGTHWPDVHLIMSFFHV